MDFSAFDHPQPAVSIAAAEKYVSEAYGVIGEAQALAGERDRSFLIDTGEERFVLKVGNRGDHPEALSVQAAAVDWVKQQDPSLPVPRIIPTADGSLTGSHNGHHLQLSEFVEGRVSRSDVLTPAFRRSLGNVAARLDLALAGFEHPLLRRSFPWNVTQLPSLRPLIELATDGQDLIIGELDHFEAYVGPSLAKLASQTIHGDLNSDNLVVDLADPERISGVFDFGDMCHAPPVVDLAIAATYQSPDADPMEVMVQIATAYHLQRPLAVGEVRLLPDLIAARCAQSLLMSARQFRANPDNSEYVTSDVGEMTTTLRWLSDANRRKSVDALLSACALGTGVRKPTDQTLILRRAHMAASYRLSYNDPIHLTSAEGVWLTDQDGRRLLDAYNNVPHVGHGHPQVVAALAAQSRRLNTNTRYLVDEVVGYAARVADLFPDPLSVVFFTNSGSEANDLAYRIATAVSGATGVITAANAYHGATTVTAAMSPEEHDVSTLAEWSKPVELSRHLTGLTEGVESTLAAAGENVAMVIVDTIFSTEGIHLAPPQLLQALRDWAQSRGAVLVADEVQAGFGRVGTQFWGFGDVTPDIVTLGKPIGNGYPMGAVVTTREIADRFSGQSTYFSTFAGSSVAAAVGNAVLDVVESEHLPAHADDVGGYLRRSIYGIDSVKAVRGAGLFIGVELETEDRAAGAVEEMRLRGVLIGRTGPRGDVLKIRPPMVFQRHHADRLLEELASVLS